MYGRRSIPVDGGLPCSVVCAVEHVQEHKPDVARIIPIHGNPIRIGFGFGFGEFRVDSRTSVGLFKVVPTAPDDHREDEKNGEGDLCSNGATHALDIETVAPYRCSDDLGEPIQHAVQRPGAGVEVGSVYGVKLVDVEPVGGEEHRE